MFESSQFDQFLAETGAFTGDWLNVQEFPAMQWTVPGIIPEGFGLLVGAPKMGKSWFALDVALRKSAGGRVLGAIDCEPEPVLYLALEDGERRLQGRSRHLLGENGRIPSGLTFITKVNPIDLVSTIEAFLECYSDRSPLVIIDTLGKVMPAAKPGESAYERDYRFGGKLKEISDRYVGSTIKVVHHTRKAAAEDFVEATSGSNGLAGSADFVLVLNRRRTETDAVLSVTGRDVVEAEYAMTTDNGRWSLKGASLEEAAAAAVEVKSTSGVGDRSADVIAFVSRHPNGVAPKAVSEALDLPDARRYLARLAEADRLRKIGRGLYGPVPTVPMSHSDARTNVWLGSGEPLEL
ncbi:AAA family ATPase [Rhodococcus artemisiae]|uniref:AAA family ATPase n=1 Tax=Rhodococcus artemisiae TaxID=714159 RepID=A0ABU7LI53_9NOCA|nr:AAA family ATPase [Rhodococcus artemisiae]MEE2061234.1 AAA family ATPase [Rhodococcus artemisiae]